MKETSSGSIQPDTRLCYPAKKTVSAIRLSQDKYCSVAATVSGVAQITTEYEIVA